MIRILDKFMARIMIAGCHWQRLWAASDCSAVNGAFVFRKIDASALTTMRELVVLRFPGSTGFMALDYAFMFYKNDGKTPTKDFVALVTDLNDVWVSGARQAAPRSGLELGRMLDTMRATKTLHFVFDGWQKTAVHRLMTAHTTGMGLKAKMSASEKVYKPEKTVKCHASYIPGTHISQVQCETFDIAKLEHSLIANEVMDVRIGQFLPVAGGEGGGYFVQLWITG